MAQSRRKSDGTVFAYTTKSGKAFYRWQVSLPLDPNDPSAGKKRYSKGGFLTYKQADNAMRDAVKESEKGRMPITDVTLFGDYAKEWLASLKIANSTRVGYEKIIRVHLLPQFGNNKLTDITGASIGSFYRKFEANGSQSRYTPGAGLSSNTVNKIHVVLGSLLQSAVYDGKLNTNPARHNPKAVNAPTGADIRQEQEELETWTAEQLKAFLEWDTHTFNDDIYAIWHVLAMTGMRRGEAVALQWKDVNLANATISIRRSTDSALRKTVKNSTKTKRNRAVMVDEATLAALKEHKLARSQVGLHSVQPDSYIFGTLDGTVRNPGDVGARFARAVAEAQKAIPGLPHLTIKGLRHTHATLMLEAGVIPKVVQERLGHANISTTMDIYSHVTATMQVDAVEQLQKWIASA
jgi:integrase